MSKRWVSSMIMIASVVMAAPASAETPGETKGRIEKGTEEGVELHAKEIADAIAAWAKDEHAKMQKKLADYRDHLEKAQHKLPAAQIEKQVAREKEILSRAYVNALIRKLDQEFHKYAPALDAEINAKADEIYFAERDVWLPKIEAGLAAAHKDVKIADLAPVREALWNHVAAER